jgi:hypothetical protein
MADIPDITLSPDTRPLSADDLFDQDKTLLRALQGHLQAMIREVADAPRRSKGGDPLPPPLFRPDPGRTPRILMLDGARGTGKTSLMLTLLDRAERGRDRSTGRPKATADWPDGDRDWADPGVLSRVWCMRPLDLDPIPPGMPLLGWVIRHFSALTEWLDAKGYGPRPTHAKSGELPDLLQAAAKRLSNDRALTSMWCDLHDTALQAWAVGGKMRIEVGELREWVTDQRQRQVAWGRFTEQWTQFIDHLLGAMEDASLLDRTGLLVIPIDDLDMQLARAAEALRMLRLFFHPRVCFLVTGDSKHLIDVLQMDYEGRQRRIVRGEDIPETNVSAQLLAKELARKHIPLPARIKTRMLSYADVVAWRGRSVVGLFGKRTLFRELDQLIRGTPLETEALFTIREWSQLFAFMESESKRRPGPLGVYVFLRGLHRALRKTRTREASNSGQSLFRLSWSDAQPHIVVRSASGEWTARRPLEITLSGDEVELFRAGRTSICGPSNTKLATREGTLSEFDRLLLRLAARRRTRRSQGIDTTGIGVQRHAPPVHLHSVWQDAERVVVPWVGVAAEGVEELLRQAENVQTYVLGSELSPAELVSIWVRMNLSWDQKVSDPLDGPWTIYTTLEAIPECKNPLPEETRDSSDGAESTVKRFRLPTNALRLAAEPSTKLSWFAWLGVPALAHPVMGLPEDEAREILAWSFSDIKHPRLSPEWREQSGHWLDLWEQWLQSCGAPDGALQLEQHAWLSPWASARRESQLGPVAWLKEATLRSKSSGGRFTKRAWSLESLFQLSESAPDLPGNGPTPAGDAVGAIIARYVARRKTWRQHAEDWHDAHKGLGGIWSHGAAAGAHETLAELWEFCCMLADRDHRTDEVSLSADGTDLTVRPPAPALFETRAVETLDPLMTPYVVTWTKDLDPNADELLSTVLRAVESIVHSTEDHAPEDHTPRDTLADLIALQTHRFRLSPPPLRLHALRIAWWTIWNHECERSQLKPRVAEAGHRRRWLHLFCEVSRHAIEGPRGLGGGATWYSPEDRFPTDSDIIESYDSLVKAAKEPRASVVLAGSMDGWLTDVYRAVRRTTYIELEAPAGGEIF